MINNFFQDGGGYTSIEFGMYYNTTRLINYQMAKV
jgi:hypothetical protein